MRIQKRLRAWTGLFFVMSEKKCVCRCPGGLCRIDTTMVKVYFVYIILGEFITLPFFCEIIQSNEIPNLLVASYKKKVMYVIWCAKIIQVDVSPLQCKLYFECVTGFKRLVL